MTVEAVRFRGADGIDLAADRRGPAGARPVVLLHGGGQTRHAWGGTAAALADDGWQALSLDLRGHGDSGWAPGGDYRLESFTRDLREVTGQLDERPVLVGASLGGLATLLLEGEVAPGSAAAVILVDVAPRIEREGADRIIAFMSARPDGFEDLEDVAAAVAAYLPHRPPPDELSGLAKNLRQGEDGRWRWHWDPAFLSPSGPGALEDSDRLRRCARALRPPTLLVRGRMSDIVSEEGAQELLEDCPHAEFVDVSGAGHMVAGDRNDAFTAAVVEFLSQLPEG